MGMDREAEVQRLNEADGHIAKTERHITAQRALVERLRAGGHDTHEAERLLKTMEETLAAEYDHRKLTLEMIDQIDAGLA
jgi:hypothetical protein